MMNLKLGEKEKYDIDEEIIEKYNIQEGTISPFTRLRVIDIENVKDEIDIKRPIVDTGVDIKKVTSDIIDTGVDIKKPTPKEEIDIKRIKK